MIQIGYKCSCKLNQFPSNSWDEAGEMAQQVRLDFDSQHPHGRWQPCTTPVLGNPVLSSGAQTYR